MLNDISVNCYQLIEPCDDMYGIMNTMTYDGISVKSVVETLRFKPNAICLPFQVSTNN